MKSKKYLLSLCLCGIMSAISVVLQLPIFEISLPFLIPEFIVLDFSDLPALLTAFTAGPVWGGIVCIIKNIVHFAFTTTGGIGELANGLMGVAFVVPAGLIYKYRHTKSGAFIGGSVGAAAGAVVSFPVNMIITYPFYIGVFFGGQVEPLLDTYNVIFGTNFGLTEVLLVFNLPFTFAKYMLSVLIALLIYKPLSPIFKKFK
ncbi:MAG: ECF transporter S component [Clostridia bacterium]|nr:ECF transporter S component [Clostridia bacterium]